MAASPESSASSGYEIVSSRASRPGESKLDCNEIQNMISRYTLHVHEVQEKVQQVNKYFKGENPRWVQHTRINQTMPRNTGRFMLPKIKGESDNKKANHIQELKTLTAELQQLEKEGECLNAKLTKAKQFGEEYESQCQTNKENIEIIRILKIQIRELESKKEVNDALIAEKAKSNVILEGKMETMATEVTVMKNDMSDLKNLVTQMKGKMDEDQKASKTRDEDMKRILKNLDGRLSNQEEVPKNEQPKKIWHN